MLSMTADVARLGGDDFVKLKTSCGNKRGGKEKEKKNSFNICPKTTQTDITSFFLMTSWTRYTANMTMGSYVTTYSR